MNTTLINCMAIGAAGFVGALARFGIVRLFEWMHWTSARSFPWATFVINITGSAFLGWFYTFMGKHMAGPNSQTIRLAIATGFVGAYTTFSTYMYESNSLLAEGSTLQAGTYLIGSLILGLIAVRLGVILGK